MKISSAGSTGYTGVLGSIPEAERLLQETRDEYQGSLDKARRVVRCGKLGLKGMVAGGAVALGSLALKSLGPGLAVAGVIVGGVVGAAGGVAWQWAEMEAQELRLVLPHLEQSVSNHERILELVTQRVEQQMETERQKAEREVTRLAEGLKESQARRVILKEKVVVVNGIPVPRRAGSGAGQSTV